MFVYAAEVAQTVQEGPVRGGRPHRRVRWSDIVCGCSAASTRWRPAAALPAVPPQRERVRQPLTQLRRAAPRTATGCAPRPVTSSPPSRWSSRPGHAPPCPADRWLRGDGAHQRHHHAHRRPAQHLLIVGVGSPSPPSSPRVLLAGQPRDVGDPRRHHAAVTATTPSANGSPTSPPRSGIATCNTGSGRTRRLGGGRGPRRRSTVHGRHRSGSHRRVPNGDQLDADTVRVEVVDGLVVDEYHDHHGPRHFRAQRRVLPISSSVANHEARGGQAQPAGRTGTTLDNLQPADRYVPSAVFADPQIACVGLSETRFARPDTTSGS